MMVKIMQRRVFSAYFTFTITHFTSVLCVSLSAKPKACNKPGFTSDLALHWTDNKETLKIYLSYKELPEL
jgi:hypothetical protein